MYRVTSTGYRVEVHSCSSTTNKHKSFVVVVHVVGSSTGSSRVEEEEVDDFDDCIKKTFFTLYTFKKMLHLYYYEKMKCLFYLLCIFYNLL